MTEILSNPDDHIREDFVRLFKKYGEFFKDGQCPHPGITFHSSSLVYPEDNEQALAVQREIQRLERAIRDTSFSPETETYLSSNMSSPVFKSTSE